jgi:HSP20 family molecular chaperone IbpA
MKDKFKILSEETNRILELNTKLNKKISLNESTPRNLTVIVKDNSNQLIPGVTVYDPDNTTVYGNTGNDGKTILKNFSGSKITLTMVGFENQIVTVDDNKQSIDVLLKTQSAELGQVNVKSIRIAKIQCLDSKSGEPIEGLKISLKDLKTDENTEILTDKNGVFNFDYSKYKTKVSVNNGTTYQSFDLTKKEDDEIPKDKVFKTIKFQNYIKIKLQLKDSEHGTPIDVTEDLLNDVKVIMDDDTATNKRLDVDKDEPNEDGLIVINFPQTSFSDSTKLIIKLPGYLKKSVELTSKPTNTIVVTLTAEVEDPERIKLPKGIRLGDVYESKTLYDVMRKYLGLCGEKYQEY